MDDLTYAKKLPTFVSGYTVAVKPLMPYYMDVIEQAYPYTEYPKRVVKLAAGDEYGFEYTPPAEPPDVSDVEYELWVKWHYAQEFNDDVDVRRNKARPDFLLANCVIVMDGPRPITDIEWVHEVEAALQPDFHVPKHPGSLFLLFLKTQVIRLPAERDLILETCTSYQEATWQGIYDALRRFQS